IELALVEPSFAPIYFEIVSREREYLSEWLLWPPLAKSEEFFLNFITKSLHEYADGKTMVCAIIHGNELVGNVGLHNISDPEKSGEIGYWLRERFQGKGIVSRAVKQMMMVGFELYSLNTIFIEAAMENTSSRAVCERLGFKLDKVNAKPSELHGREVTHAIYRMER
ncbi:MAG: GNAT family N-acetyltransferase, partial [Kangiellaceae bacterium]|nr:GNAT family N-acetyltransferase [Kangiellaceae bacterium]